MQRRKVAQSTAGCAYLKSSAPKPSYRRMRAEDLALDDTIATGTSDAAAQTCKAVVPTTVIIAGQQEMGAYSPHAYAYAYKLFVAPTMHAVPEVSRDVFGPKPGEKAPLAGQAGHRCCTAQQMGQPAPPSSVVVISSAHWMAALLATAR